MDATAIASLRHSLGLSQAQFATRLGVSLRSVLNWEHGAHPPSPMALVLLSGLKRDAARAERKPKLAMPDAPAAYVEEAPREQA